jgi:hypothetical protein
MILSKGVCDEEITFLKNVRAGASAQDLSGLPSRSEVTFLGCASFVRFSGALLHRNGGLSFADETSLKKAKTVNSCGKR